MGEGNKSHFLSNTLWSGQRAGNAPRMGLTRDQTALSTAATIFSTAGNNINSKNSRNISDTGSRYSLVSQTQQFAQDGFCAGKTLHFSSNTCTASNATNLDNISKTDNPSKVTLIAVVTLLVWCYRHSNAPKMGFEKEMRYIFQATHTPLVVLAIPKNIDNSSNLSEVTLIAVVTRYVWCDRHSNAPKIG